MLASFERLRVGNALTITQETLRSGHRFELEYILGSFCERASKKCGHASLSAEILHNLLSLRSRSVRPSVNRRVYPADCSSPIRYPGSRPGWAGLNAIRSTTSARVHHAARSRTHRSLGKRTAVSRSSAIADRTI